MPCEVQDLGSLENYQQAVGGLSEPVVDSVDLSRISATLCVNDEGLILDLPFNVRATTVRWFWLPGTLRHSTVLGDFVLAVMPDRRGNTTRRLGARRQPDERARTEGRGEADRHPQRYVSQQRFANSTRPCGRVVGHATARQLIKNLRTGWWHDPVSLA